MRSIRVSSIIITEGRFLCPFHWESVNWGGWKDHDLSEIPGNPNSIGRDIFVTLGIAIYTLVTGEQRNEINI